MFTGKGWTYNLKHPVLFEIKAKYLWNLKRFNTILITSYCGVCIVYSDNVNYIASMFPCSLPECWNGHAQSVVGVALFGYISPK